MASLYWKKKSARIKLVAPAEFSSEQEFEQVVFSNSELLEDIFLLKRQVRGGDKSGIPDIIGIDDDSNVCIIEMKNKPVDADIIPQILKYAIWAERNPDSIKILWNEAEDRPDDLDIDWENLTIRLIVIAPTIERSTTDHLGKIDYEVDLLEIARWTLGKDSWILVNRIDPAPSKKNRPVSGLSDYDQKAYEKFHKPDAARAFMQACTDLHRLAKSNRWDVDPNYKKNYCAFKAGKKNVFGVKWIGSRSFGFFAKVPEEIGRRIKIAGCERRLRHDRVMFIPKSPSFSVQRLRRVMAQALKMSRR